MSNYSRILNEFVQKLGCNENDRFNEYGLNKSLDKLTQANAGHNEFNRDVSVEIFQQTPKNNDGTVTLRDFINTVLRAVEILSRQINQTQRQIQYANNQTDREEYQGNLQQFTDDLLLINRTFNLQGGDRNSGSRLANSYGPVNRSRKVQGFQSNSSRGPAASKQNSGIFVTQTSQRQESFSLKVALMILLLSFLFELILMFVKDPFISSLAYILVFGIYLLNYFDRSYVRVCLGALLVSVILDFIWLFVMAGPYLNNQPGYRSNLQSGFLGFAYVMTIILMAAKAIIFIILIRFRSNTEATRKSVRLFNLRFDLDARPINSPVYNIMNNQQSANYSAQGAY